VCHSPLATSDRFEALNACLEFQSLQAFQRVLWSCNQEGDPLKTQKCICVIVIDKFIENLPINNIYAYLSNKFD
jgi:hypothetical protein